MGLPIRDLLGLLAFAGFGVVGPLTCDEQRGRPVFVLPKERRQKSETPAKPKRTPAIRRTKPTRRYHKRRTSDQ